MHPALTRVADATRGTPFEGRIWLVGGAVRDELLGNEPEAADFDLVTDLDAVELAGHLYESGASALAPVVYPRFGTALVRVEDANVELVTARRESYGEESRKPDVEPATLEEDALRRDFTVNTLLRNVHTGELSDPLGSGLADLRERRLRTPLDPVRTFFDDPLRMLRAVRFRWSLGFEPASGLYEAIREEAPRLDIVSAERIRDEWAKMLGRSTASSAMRDLMQLGLLDRFLPEFREGIGVEQGNYHHLDVWDHTLLVVDRLWDSSRVANVGEPSLALVLAALFHDIGKPRTRSVDPDGAVRFFGHETVGAAMTEVALRRLRFAQSEIDPVVLLVKSHMRLGSFHEFTPAAARRLLRDLGEEVEPLLRLVEADAESLRPGVRALDLSPIRTRLEEVRHATPAETLESPLSGAEIMDLMGLEPGPQIGQLKALLVEEVLEGRIAPGDKTAAARFLAKASLFD